MKTGISILLAVTLLVSLQSPHVAHGAGGQRTSREGAPGQVPSPARIKLSARMTRHGKVMEELVRAVVLLDRPRVEALARRIANDESLSVSSSSIEERRQRTLPPEVVVEQTRLGDVARRLSAAAAADSGDDDDLATRFAALTRTCVSCHSVFLRSRRP